MLKRIDHYTIAPKGRNKYGTYVSSSNTTKVVSSTIYGGNDTTTTLGNDVSVPTDPKYLNYPYVSGGTWWVGDNNTGIIASAGDIVNIVNDFWYINNTPTNFSVQYANAKDTNWLLFLDKTSDVIDGYEITAAGAVVDIHPIGYVGSSKGMTYVGDLSVGYQQTNWGITGMESGMNINVVSNGTSVTTIQVQFYPTYAGTGGTLSIPCNVYKGTRDEMGDDYYKWMENGEDVQAATLLWTWKINVEAMSSYVLDLSNEIAGINCDADGNVVPGAIMPECEGVLYYGTSIMTGATYSYYVHPNYQVSGLTATTSTTGITLQFDSNTFSFEGTTLAIKVRANVAGAQFEKTMNVVKNLPGASGEDAITRWLVPSIDTMVVGNGGTINNQQTCTFKVKMMMQEGGNEPVEDTTTPIYQRFGTTDSWYLSGQTDPSIIIGDTSYVYQDPRSALTMSYALLNEIRAEKVPSPSEWQFAILSASGTPIEMEGIPWIYNGAKGDSGATGERGAVVRGPYNWYELENQRYSNGLGPNAEDKLWIDILVKDGVYFRCTTSHNYTGEQWEGDEENYWTQSNESYDFVATNLLLANNAKINIMTSNEIYFGSGSTITGGMKGGTGDTIAFWAGNSEQDPNFFVDHNGKLMAKEGKFYGNVYIPFTPLSELPTTYISISGVQTICYQPGVSGQVISDIYIDGGGEHIILPEPTADLYGFTYRFMAGAGRYRSGSFGTTDFLCGLKVIPCEYANRSDTSLPIGKRQIIDFTYRTGIGASYGRLSINGGEQSGVQGGSLTICCMPFLQSNGSAGGPYTITPVWGLIAFEGDFTHNM